MRRSVTSRLGAAAAALVFAATSGVTSMEAHPLSGHGPHATEILALELGGVAEAANDAHTHHGAEQPQTSAHQGHAAHDGASERTTHGGHSSHHGSSTECTCVGPCVGGAPPTISEAAFADIVPMDTAPERVVPVPVRLIPQDPRSHLLPLPNAPPASV